MKKMMLVGALLLAGATAYGQESRQDASISATGLLGPSIYGNAVVETQTKTLGILASYRYMLTPHSALEVNYGFAQNTTKFKTSSLAGGVHTRPQEFSAAYVYSLNFRNFNPFLEAGPGAILFSPVKDNGTTLSLDVKRNTSIGGVVGGGVAYELSPSFDIRAEYRAFIVKAPDFGLADFKTNRYEVISIPAIGIAYHF